MRYSDLNIRALRIFIQSFHKYVIFIILYNKYFCYCATILSTKYSYYYIIILSSNGKICRIIMEKQYYEYQNSSIRICDSYGGSDNVFGKCFC